MQKTPAAVSVVSSDDVVKRQLVDVRGLGTFLPSFKTNVEGTATQFFARGVGKQYDQGRIPDAVALVVDGLNIPQHASGLTLFDVSSIQVLPGPQGTLYGSSAIGGVVNITTNRPTRNLGGSVLVDAGNYGTFHATAVINVPVSDALSLRAVYNGNYHGDYNHNGTYNDHLTAFRLSALYEPNNSFSVFLTGTYAFDNYTASPTVPFPLQRNAWRPLRYDPATAFIYPPLGGITSDGRQRIQLGTVTGQIDKKLGGVTLSFISGYAHKTTPGGADINILRVAGLPFLYESDVDAFNNELRVSNRDSGRLNFIAGLYQSYHKDREFSVFGPNLSGSAYATTIKTYAVFGQATYSILDATRLTAGLRGSNDQVKASRDAQVFFPIFPAFDRGVITFNYDKNWTRLNWKVGVEQDLGPASMFYAGVQSGFNPGTFDGDPPTPAAHVQPQRMIGYTAGIKNRFFGSRLTLNLEGFYYDYRNQIQSVADLSTGYSRLTNAQKAEIYGVQLDSVAQLARNTQLRGSVGYLHGCCRRDRLRRQHPALRSEDHRQHRRHAGDRAWRPRLAGGARGQLSQQLVRAKLRQPAPLSAGLVHQDRRQPHLPAARRPLRDRRMGQEPGEHGRGGVVRRDAGPALSWRRLYRATAHLWGARPDQVLTGRSRSWAIRPRLRDTAPGWRRRRARADCCRATRTRAPVPPSTTGVLYSAPGR